MADKKRAPAKAKKPVAKRPTKPTENLETKTEEVMESENEIETQGNVAPQSFESEDLKRNGNGNGNGHEEDQEDQVTYDDEPEEDRQPDFGGPRTGVRSQDVRISDEYTIETYFDRNQRLFIATVIEYPELRCTGHTRDEAQVDLEERLEDHVYDLKARGSQPVEAMQSRTFPPKLELPLSQSLFRKLDQLSRHEKLPIDRLVAELLSAAVDKRGHGRSMQPQQNHHRDNRDNRDNRDHHQGGGRHGQNRHHGGGHRHQGGNRAPQRGGGRDNYRALDSRENFMEYVRNLEKGGGPGWKKR